MRRPPDPTPPWCQHPSCICHPSAPRDVPRRCPQEGRWGLVRLEGGEHSWALSRVPQGKVVGQPRDPPGMVAMEPSTALQHPTASPMVHPPPRLLHHLVAPGEPGLGEAVAEADNGAMSHLHKVQLDARLERTESPQWLRVAGLHPPTLHPLLATRHGSPPPPPAQHPRATQARFSPWGGWRRPQRWSQHPRCRKVDNPTIHPLAGTSFHGAQTPSPGCLGQPQARGHLVTEAVPSTLPGWARIRGSRWMDQPQLAAALLG